MADIGNPDQLRSAIERFEARVEDERKRVRDIDDRLDSQITNILIVGSIGTIIASVTFLNDIAPQPLAGSLKYPRAAWLFLFSASVLGVESLIVNRVAARHFRDLLFARLQRQDASALERRSLATRRPSGSYRPAARGFWLSARDYSCGSRT